MLKYLLPLFAATLLSHAQSPGIRSPGPVIISTQGGVNQTIITNGIDGNTAASIAATNAAWAITNGHVGDVVRYVTPTRPANANSNWFGPWTAGTTTAGLQEAWDSVPKPTDAGPVARGVKFVFQSGYYYLTNPIVFSNYWPIGMTFEGQSLMDTAIVYAGVLGGTNMLTFRGAGTPRATSLNIPLHLDVRNIRFSAIHDNTNVLVHVQDYSYAKFENCNFEGWQSMTNQIEGAGVSLSDASAWTTNGNLVGLRTVGPNEHSTIGDNLFFAALATGWHAANDHVTANSIKFARVGRRVTKWPATSIYSLGACIIREGSLDDDWFYCHFYNSKLGFFRNGYQLGRSKLWHANFEDMEHYTAVTEASQGIELISPNFYDLLEVNTWPIYKGTYCLTASNSPNFGLLAEPAPYSVMYGYDPLAGALTKIIGSNVVVNITSNQFVLNATHEFNGAGVNNGPLTVNDPVSANVITLDASPGYGVSAANSTFSTFSLVTPEGQITASDWVSAPKFTVGTPTITSGSGAPSTDEPKGSLYLRTDGSTSTTLYVKTATGGGGWTAK